jgi:hypothetical protein
MDRHPLPRWRAFRIVFADRILGVQFAGVGELQDCGSRELFAQRCNLEFRLRRVWDLPSFDRRTVTLLDKHLTVLLGHNGPAEVFCRGKPLYVSIRPFSQILGPGEPGYSQRSQKNKNAFWSDHVQDSFSWLPRPVSSLHKPGTCYVVYEDEYQVVAEPFSDMTC